MKKNNKTERKLSKPNFFSFPSNFVFVEFKFQWLLVAGNGLVANGRNGSEGRWHPEGRAGRKKSAHGHHYGKTKPEWCSGTCHVALSQKVKLLSWCQNLMAAVIDSPSVSHRRRWKVFLIEWEWGGYWIHLGEVEIKIGLDFLPVAGRDRCQLCGHLPGHQPIRVTKI